MLSDWIKQACLKIKQKKNGNTFMRFQLKYSRPEGVTKFLLENISRLPFKIRNVYWTIETRQWPLRWISVCRNHKQEHVVAEKISLNLTERPLFNRESLWKWLNVPFWVRHTHEARPFIKKSQDCYKSA